MNRPLLLQSQWNDGGEDVVVDQRRAGIGRRWFAGVCPSGEQTVEEIRFGFQVRCRFVEIELFQEGVLVEVHLHQSHFLFVDQGSDLFVIDGELVVRRVGEALVQITLLDGGVDDLPQIDLFQGTAKEIAVGENVRRRHDGCRRLGEEVRGK